jgi:hypothetical protein
MLLFREANEVEEPTYACKLVSRGLLGMQYVLGDPDLVDDDR